MADGWFDGLFDGEDTRTAQLERQEEKALGREDEKAPEQNGKSSAGQSQENDELTQTTISVGDGRRTLDDFNSQSGKTAEDILDKFEAEMASDNPSFSHDMIRDLTTMFRADDTLLEKLEEEYSGDNSLREDLEEVIYKPDQYLETAANVEATAEAATLG